MLHIEQRNKRIYKPRYLVMFGVPIRGYPKLRRVHAPDQGPDNRDWGMWVRDKKLALKYFKANLGKGAQIDVRGGREPYCWKFWHRGKVKTQKQYKRFVRRWK